MELNLGDTGAHVLELQSKLGVEATGVYNSATRIAVIGLQLDNGLPAHGIATDVEWNLLGCKLPETNSTFKLTARDGDGDGLVQDSTPFERPTKDTNGK